ncbi:hypothetical protein FIBSPDRAFT_886655 [Athelia psychrophila]|uniref:Uncharacterized protein n=1 Tax=Athelia psychrophila TaxID=1759441 RepID=A0A166QQR8_9AGAM|nr:hypothetical protein FIBSPDRAFT_886655 [Fibularhizoctonia sp. CBS 109695]
MPIFAVLLIYRSPTLYRKLACLGDEIASGLAQAAMVMESFGMLLSMCWMGAEFMTLNREHPRSSSYAQNTPRPSDPPHSQQTRHKKQIYERASPPHPLFYSAQVGSPAVGHDYHGIAAFSTTNGGISDETDLTHARTAPKDDETITQTLGIGCACCWGDFAKSCLVFSKWSLLHLLLTVARETGSYIMCLNRDFEAFDCTLVTLMSYRMHAAMGLPGQEVIWRLSISGPVIITAAHRLYGYCSVDYNPTARIGSSSTRLNLSLRNSGTGGGRSLYI